MSASLAMLIESDALISKVKVTGYSSLQHASPLPQLTSHNTVHYMDHTVLPACHPAAVTFPPLPQLIKTGIGLSDPGKMQG